MYVYMCVCMCVFVCVYVNSQLVYSGVLRGHTHALARNRVFWGWYSGVLEILCVYTLVVILVVSSKFLANTPE